MLRVFIKPDKLLFPKPDKYLKGTGEQGLRAGWPGAALLFPQGCGLQTFPHPHGSATALLHRQPNINIKQPLRGLSDQDKQDHAYACTNSEKTTALSNYKSDQIAPRLAGAGLLPPCHDSFSLTLSFLSFR